MSGLNTFSGHVLVQERELTITNSQSLGLGSKTITINNNSIHLPTLNLNAPGGSINLPSSFTYSVSHNDSANGSTFNSIAGNNTIAGHKHYLGRRRRRLQRQRRQLLDRDGQCPAVRC